MEMTFFKKHNKTDQRLQVNSSLKRYKYLLEQAANLDSPPVENKKKKKFCAIVMPKIHGWSFDLPYSLLTGLFRR